MIRLVMITPSTNAHAQVNPASNFLKAFVHVNFFSIMESDLGACFSSAHGHNVMGINQDGALFCPLGWKM